MGDELRAGAAPKGDEELGLPTEQEAEAPGADLSATGEAQPANPGGTSQADSLCPVVGIGASAGGLAALERFFSGTARDGASGLAVVVVQHLDPDHKSILTELIRQYTDMPVHEARDGMTAEPGNVYVVPPNKDITLAHTRLRLAEPSNPHGLRLPIDFFLRSLAKERREQAVAVILSGTGSDGTLGLKAVKEAGGLVVVQQPETAQYDGMPRSAIGTRLADYVLSPEEMAARITEYMQRSGGYAVQAPAREAEAASSLEPLLKLFGLLRAQTGHDFSRYKRNTIIRRIDRRIVVHELASLDAYVNYLRRNPAEVDVLFRELLIGVTNFFRDPEVWAAVEETVIPALFAEKRAGDAIRVWTPGCSTGEEAYTIAILLHEFITRTRADVTAQIFATDIDTEALDQARAAVYPESIAADVTPERLDRFFVAEGNTYRLKKAVRDTVIFASQNVGEDPPFSRVDLVSCRNLLIYMNTDLQRRVLPLFHYALNPHGFLLLGTSESVGEFTDLFTTVDRKRKIFAHKPGGHPHRASVDFSRIPPLLEAPTRRFPREVREGPTDIRQVLEQVLLTQHTPAAVVVAGDGEVVYIHGRTGYYLEPAQGDATLNVVRMAREGLRLELSSALRKAIASQEKVTHPGLIVRTNGGSQSINLIVRPMQESPRSGLYLIVFEQASTDERSKVAEAPSPGDKDGRITSLERELRSKEEYLQATVEELETSNEELTSTNEELQSANEELQSTNEELETSKEELQSVNEELMTVNVELQKKIEELSRLNNDLNNLLAGTGIGTVFVDRNLRIQRFTPAATDIINLIQTDIGRPVAHIVSNFMSYPDLIRDATTVLDTLIPREREVQVINGRWYLMRLQPYRTLDNVIEGAVLTFVDITTQKQMQVALEESRRMRVESVFDPVLVLNHAGKITDFNLDALDLLGYAENELRELRMAELVAVESYADFRAALSTVAEGESARVELILWRKDRGKVTAHARLRRIDTGDSGSTFVVLRRSETQDGAE